MEIHFKIVGILLMALSTIHIIFPKYFNWKENLSPLSLINRQMMYVHTLFIALVAFLTGLLCFTSSAELIGTPLGRKLCLGFGIFWSLRLVIQFFGYSPTHWKGKLFETTIHILFTLLWAYFSILFLTSYFQ
jgi:hypothetical protein